MGYPRSIVVNYARGLQNLGVCVIGRWWYDVLPTSLAIEPLAQFVIGRRNEPLLVSKCVTFALRK